MIVNHVSFKGLANPSSKWNEPTLKDYTGSSDWKSLTKEQKMKIKNHYLLTAWKKNPPETFGQLKLPIIGTDGLLYKHALDNAAARVNQVKNLEKEDEKQVNNKIQKLQTKYFHE